MRKNIETLIEISRPHTMDASLPFVFTNLSGEKKVAWFIFHGDAMNEPCNVTVSKIFLLNNGNNIETFDVNINLKIIIEDLSSPTCDRSAYIKKFNQQFETNQFDDVMELLSTAEPAPLLDIYETVIDYLKKSRNMVCKHCGSNTGFFTKLTGVQYYTNTGDDDGYTVDAQNSSVYCRACKKRVCSFNEFQKEVSHGN